MRPELEDLLAETKAKRELKAKQDRNEERRKEIRVFYVEYLNNIGADEKAQLLMPNLADLCGIPSIKNIIDSDDAMSAFSKERWEAVLPSLPDAFESHRRRMIDFADSLVEKQLRLQMGGDDPSVLPQSASQESGVPLHRRATSFFTCRNRLIGERRLLMPFPEILGVTHGRNSYNEQRMMPSSTPWTGSTLQVLPWHLQCAEAVLQSLGMNEEEVSWDDMYALGQRFQCSRCPNEMKQDFTWSNLVRPSIR